MTAFPKPVKRTKKKPGGIRRRRWGVKRKARGTAHSRRPRELGRMAWLHSLRMCFIWGFFRTLAPELDVDSEADREALSAIQAAAGLGIQCGGGWFEVAHLFGRYGEGDRFTVLLCLDHHHDVDQTRRWFRKLTREQRVFLKTYLARRATAAWEAQPPAVRAHWDEVGAAQQRGDA